MFMMSKSFGEGKGIRVQTSEVEKRTIKEMVSASGKIFPEIELSISSDVSGELVELYVKEGDSVTVGQILAKIDPEVFQSAVERVSATVDNTKAQLANSKANLSRAEAGLQQVIAQQKQIEAQIENAKTVHSRNEQLLKDGVIAQADFDNSLSSLRSLEANLEAGKATIASSEAGVEAAKQTVKGAEFSVKSAEASLKETNTSLKRTSVFAPMSGVISMLGKEKGETVLGTTQMTGDIIFKIANLSQMEIQVDVSENDVLRVGLGDKVEIEVDAYQDRAFTGVVTEIANSASNTTGAMALTTDQVTNFTVKIRIDRSSYEDLLGKGRRFPFRPGMSGSVEINTETVKDVVSVPIQAVTTRTDEEKKKKTGDDEVLEVVFLLEGDTSRMVEVKTGLQDDEYIQILSGLESGQTIVKGPYSAVSKTLEDGKLVRKDDGKDKGEKKGWGK